VERRACEAGVSALAWNRPDGTVEVRADGGKTALEALLRQLETGPPAARVDRVDESWSELPGAGKRSGEE
jgi:acylphosphatase